LKIAREHRPGREFLSLKNDVLDGVLEVSREHRFVARPEQVLCCTLDLEGSLPQEGNHKRPCPKVRFMVKKGCPYEDTGMAWAISRFVQINS
jgi:hypothetical protein